MQSDTEQTPSVPTRLIPLTDWPKYHPWPTVSGMRHLAFYREANGADAWIVMVGRRLLVDEAAFLEWARKGVATPDAATGAAKTKRGAR